MIELISVILVEFLGLILIEGLFGGVFRGLRWIGYRIFSVLTGETDLPVSEIRKKHDGSIWPWVIIFALVVGIPVFVVVLYQIL